MWIRTYAAVVACVTLWPVAGAAVAAEQLGTSSLPNVTADTAFLARYDKGRLAATVATGKAAPVSGAAELIDGERGRALRLGPGEQLVYDAAGNIDLNQGSVELWIDTRWSPQQRTRTHHLFAHPLEWTAPGNMRLWYWSTGETGGVLRFDHHAAGPGGEGFVVAAWPGNGRHHIAARWHHKDGMALYVDGRKVAEKRGTWKALPPAAGVLELSSPDRPAEVSLQALRVRKEPAYAAGEPQAVLSVKDASCLVREGTTYATAPMRLMNRRGETLKGSLHVKVRDYFGEPVHESREEISMEGFSEHVAQVEFAVLRPSRYFAIEMAFSDAQGAVVARREQIVTVGALTGTRKALCLDGEWEYADGAWGELTVPATGWRPTIVPRKERSLPTHIRWYRRSFVAPDNFGAHVRLVPRHIKQRARWWVNGVQVGDSEYAYVPYSFDISDALRPGAENEIVVAVMDWVECADPALQEHLATTHPASGRVIEGRPLIKPCGGEVLPAGIIESVWVYGHGDVWVSDVVAVTSTKDSTLTVRGIVHNEAPERRSCRVGNAVFDGEAVALTLPDSTVQVDARGEQEFELTIAWEDAKLWWPHSPHMYRLQTTALTSERATDQLSTRFGFREFRAEGEHFVLNETPMHLFAASSWPNSVPIGLPGHLRDRWDETKALLESLRESGHDIYRAHTEPWSDLLADLCDEVGLMLVTEGVMSSIPGRYAWDHPDLMTRFKEFFRLWPGREMNHPALVMRSIENEIGYLLHERHMSPEAIPQVREGFIECGRIVKQADPSRPITYEGSGPDFYEVADVYNNHYPGDEYHWTEYPNSSWWPGRPMDCYRVKDWMWDRNKPLYMGEWGWFPGGQEKFAAYMGPQVYRPGATYGGAKATLWAMGIAGMRYHGVSATCPWNVLEGAGGRPIATSRPRHRAVREGFAKLKVAIRERGSVYFAGKKLTRTVSAYNDTLQPRELTVCWRVVVAGDEVEAGSWCEETAPAGITRRAITIELPRRKEGPFSGRFEAVLQVDGEDCSSAESAFRVFPRLAGQEHISVATLGVRSSTLRGLKRLQVDVREISGIDALSALGIPLIVGPRADLSAEDRPALERFVRGGGQLVVLDQGRQPKWLPMQAELVTEQPLTRLFIAWPGSPVIGGLVEGDFSFWPEDHVVTDSGWKRPDGLRFRPVLHGGIGLATSPLAEVRLGAGRLWLAQLPLWSNTPRNPVVERIGQNLLGSLGGFRGESGRALGVVASPRSDVEALLTDAGARPFLLTGKLGEVDLAEYGAVVIDAAPQIMPEVTQNAARLRAFAASGGTVWLHRVRPETVTDVSRLCGRRIELTAAFDLPFTLQAHAMTAGMSEAQLYWSADPNRFSAVKPDVADHVLRVVGGVELTRPAALVALPRGEGSFLMDQLAWESEFRNRGRAKELVAGLCANLGVELSPREGAEPAPTFIAHFDTTANADYAAGGAEPVWQAGIEFIEGRFGAALKFAGAEELQYEQRGNLDINRGTLEMWYKGVITDNQLLFRTTPKEFDDTDFVALWIWNGLLRFDHHSMPGGPGTGYILHTLEPSSDWRHIAATWDQTDGIALYLNGEMVAASKGTWETTEARFRQFTLSSPHRPVTGAMDEVRILNYARSPEQIKQDAAASAPFVAPTTDQAPEWVPGMPE